MSMVRGHINIPNKHSFPFTLNGHHNLKKQQDVTGETFKTLHLTPTKYRKHTLQTVRILA